MATGTDYTIDVKEFISDDPYCNERLYNESLAKLEDHIKSVLKDGDTICIASSVAFHSCVKEFPKNIAAADWLLTLGDASGAFCVIASRTGNRYTINGTYYIADTYDFDKNDYNAILPGLTNDAMFKLHSAGVAQAFCIHGEMEMNYVF